MISRVSEKVFLQLFEGASRGKRRIPLKIAINKLNLFFNSPENPYRAQMGGDSIGHISAEEFMDQFYSRNVDKRHGLRSQILMGGGPKNLRGNPRGPVDSMLSFPQITFEEFYGIAKDMECVFLERILDRPCGSKLTATYNTREFQEVQKKENSRVVNLARRVGMD